MFKNNILQIFANDLEIVEIGICMRLFVNFPTLNVNSPILNFNMKTSFIA